MSQSRTALATTVHAAEPRLRAAGCGLGVLAGVGLAGQARINGELGARLHDGIETALISFGTGLAVMCVLVGAFPAGRRGLVRLRGALRSGELRVWQCLGGASGGFLVITQGVTVATLGVAVFTVATVAGQSTSSLLVDRFGLGPSGSEPFTLRRVTGAVLAVGAVVVAVGDRLGSASAVGLAALPALAGIGSAWQQAVNGRVKAAASSALTATLVNFFVGSAVLLVAFGVDLALRGPHLRHLPGQPWLYVGGSIGIVFIGIAAAVVRHTGVLLLGLSMISGQLIAALVLDLIAPEPGSHPGPNTLVGILLTLVAVAFTAARRAHR